MANRFRILMDRLLHRRMLRLWNRAARTAADVDLAELRGIRSRARQVRRRIDQALYIADERLTLPYIGTNAIVKPLHCDWAHRPQLWRGPLSPPGRAAVANREMIGDEMTVFHDCAISELTVRQVRNTREEDLAPFGLRMEVFRFDGSFLSLAIDLPPDVADGLLRRHVIRATINILSEKPLEVFARLNVKHGPNTEQLVRELPFDEDEMIVEFDLAYTKLNEKRVERLWLDLIFEGPEMNQIVIHDLTLTRRPRAEF